MLYRLSYEASTGVGRVNLGSEFAANIRMIQVYIYIVVEPRSTRDIEILFKLIVKVLVVGNTADTPEIPLGCYPFKGNMRVPTYQRKFRPSGV